MSKQDKKGNVVITMLKRELRLFIVIYVGNSRTLKKRRNEDDETMDNMGYSDRIDDSKFGM